VIPTMLLVGLVVGGFVYDRRSLTRSCIIGAVASLLWGILVGVGAMSLLAAVGGTFLGVVNVAAGAVVGSSLGTACRAMLGRPEQRTSSS
jgi:hypothetical protein